MEDEKKNALEDGVVDIQGNGYKKKSPWGQWVQYNDKRGRGVFYYNLVIFYFFFENLIIDYLILMVNDLNIFLGITTKSMG